MNDRQDTQDTLHEYSAPLKQGGDTYQIWRRTSQVPRKYEIMKNGDLTDLSHAWTGGDISEYLSNLLGGDYHDR